MSANNGHGRGSNGNAISVRLARIIEHRRAELEALITARDILTRDLSERKTAKAPGLVAEAIRRSAATRPKRDGVFAASTKARRARTSKLLDVPSGHAIKAGGSTSSLLQFGYIARKGEGYVRTAKAYTP